MLAPLAPLARIVTAALAALPAGPGAPAPLVRVHPDSLSRTSIVVAGRHAKVEVTFQTLSLIETLAVDDDGDGLLAAAEVGAHGDAIAAYFLERVRVLPAVDPAVELGVGFGAPLRGAGAGAELVPRAPGDFQWMRQRLVLEAAEPLGALRVESRLFVETNPFHRDLLTFRWNDEEPWSVLFGAERGRWDFEPASRRRPGVLARFFGLGVEHILTGYDHLAFLLVLVVAARGVRALALVVTGFTAAHSVTLAAAALGWIDLPGRFVELAIALSIAYVACENLLRREPRTPWVEAFGFGLLHGLGFAGFLGDALGEEPLVTTALLGFNLGVEVGQLAAVLPVALLLALGARLRRARPATVEPRAAGEHPSVPGLAPAWLRVATSVAVGLCGFYWFVERAGWLG